MTLLGKQNSDADRNSISAGTLLLRDNDLTAAASPATFLSSRMRFSTDINGQEICVISAGGDEIGVMMGWERDLSSCNNNLLKPFDLTDTAFSATNRG